MTVGFVMLVHEALGRAAEVARAIASEGFPVVIHVDRRVATDEYDRLIETLSDLARITFSERRRCEWGTWSLVEASRDASERLLREYPEIGHVYLMSGSCLPIKPLSDLAEMLRKHPATDFIESVTIEEVPWTKGGLSEERFTLSFPFPWKRSRWLFDRWVELQRRVGRKRRLPEDLAPHMGSQWWCLSRETLERVLTDPRRGELEQYFRRVWIPDESYYQSLVRLYGCRVESRSLTLSKFDFKGQPHVFYDDHLILLRQSSAYFARKIWPAADRLYAAFLGETPEGAVRTRPASAAHIDRTFAEAVRQRTRGRPGLVMSSRCPNEGYENGVTAQKYAVFQGFDDAFCGMAEWLTDQIGGRVHGHLFAPEGAAFEGGQGTFAGGLSAAPALRDYDPDGFLRNLIWNTRGELQSFFHAPRDRQEIGEFLAADPNANMFVISGAWAIPLFRSGRTMDEVRKRAAELQAREAAFIQRLQERRTRAHVRIWTLGEALERPSEPLQALLDDLSATHAVRSESFPSLVPLAGLSKFLQSLRNAGMNPYLAGEVSDPPGGPALTLIQSQVGQR